MNNKKYIAYPFILLLGIVGIYCINTMLLTKKVNPAPNNDSKEGRPHPIVNPTPNNERISSLLKVEELPAKEKPAEFVAILDKIKKVQGLDTRNIRVPRLRGTDLQDNLAIAKDQDCIAFLGGTGSGKSTMIHAIYSPGSIYEVDQDGNSINSRSRVLKGRIYLQAREEIKRGSKVLFETGHGDTSATKYPQGVIWKNKALFDCPGFEDSFGIAKDLMHSISIGGLLKSAKRVKICFLLPESCCTGDTNRFLPLRNMINTLKALLKEDECFNSNLAKVQIVITRPIGRIGKSNIQDNLREFLKKQLGVNQGTIDAILSNLMFVDAADRPHVFADVETGWIYSSSSSQDKVSDLAARLREDEEWIEPKYFNNPLTEKARKALESLIKDTIVLQTADCGQKNRREKDKDKEAKICKEFLEKLLALGFSDLQEEISDAYQKIEEFRAADKASK